MIRNTAYFSLIPAKDYKDGKGNTIYVCKYEDPPPDILCLCIRMEIQLPYLKLDRAKTMLIKQLPETTDRFVSMNRFMDMPRQFEVLAAINRMRHVIWCITQE